MQITHRNYRPGRYISRAATREFADVAAMLPADLTRLGTIRQDPIQPCLGIICREPLQPSSPPSKIDAAPQGEAVRPPYYYPVKIKDSRYEHIETNPWKHA